MHHQLLGFCQTSRKRGLVQQQFLFAEQLNPLNSTYFCMLQGDFVQEQPAVILANHGEKGAHFLDIQITREATSSQAAAVARQLRKRCAYVTGRGTM